MKIIQEKPNPSGAFPAIQGLDFAPSGWLQVADNCDTAAMQTHAGFVAKTVVDGVVTKITGDDAAYQAWKAANPEAPAEPDTIQLALAELAETESAHDLENKLALAELAETIGGTNG